jgi:hypothetical protein
MDLEKLKSDLGAEFDKNYSTSCDVDVSQPEPGKLLVVLSRQYHFVELYFDMLKTVAKLVGSDKININHENPIRGCESCDWGSEYTMNLYVTLPGADA